MMPQKARCRTTFHDSLRIWVWAGGISWVNWQRCRAPRAITVKATKSGTAARKMRSAKLVPVVVPMSLGRAGSAV